MPKDERQATSDNITEGDLLQVDGVMSQGYGIMPKVVMRDRRLTVDAKAIYAYMVSFAGAGQTAFPKRATILADLCISKTSFYKHFQLLLDHDYIRIKRQKRGNLLGRNIYTLVMTPSPVEVKPILVEEKSRLIEVGSTINDSRCPKKQDIEQKDASFSPLSSLPMSQNTGHREKGTLVPSDVLKTRTPKKQDMNNSNKDNSNNHKLSQSFSPTSRHMQIVQDTSGQKLISSNPTAFIMTNEGQESIPERNLAEELTVRFQNQLDYDDLLETHPEKKSLVDEIIMNMVDMWICQEVRIKGQPKPQEIVRGVLARLTKPHVIRVMEKLATLDAGIKNRGGYLQTMLYMSVLEEQVHQTRMENQSGKEAVPNATKKRSGHLSVPNAKADRQSPVTNRNNFQQREYDDAFFQELEVHVSGLRKTHLIDIDT